MYPIFKNPLCLRLFGPVLLGRKRLRIDFFPHQKNGKCESKHSTSKKIGMLKLIEMRFKYDRSDDSATIYSMAIKPFEMSEKLNTLMTF